LHKRSKKLIYAITRCFLSGTTYSTSNIYASNQEGKIKEAQQKNNDAMSFYEKALAINSMHKESLIHLGILYHKQERYMLAEKALMNVVRNDPTSHEGWQVHRYIQF
jgi:tetratricopeptide (TPR) repeat protein